MGLSEFFWNLGAWNWFIVAVALFALESVVPGVHFVWFGVAAVIVGGLGLTLDIAWEWQLITFAIISCITVFFARRYAAPDITASDQPDLNVRAEQYVGRVVTVEEAISGGRGKVRVGDTVWNAQGSDAPHGARVRITGTNGTCLLVEHAFN
ncbi:MAG: NfeD family protein [Hyphomicrobium sp.]|uniref:NfeD family protein n=1 Tax=Hyphomicrobium sp. TaxID=82 RepID=UPI00132588D3|nr:NfeD family protein [Hyphomicrobium sp.]KAB2942513.1 MAG: NfeD family protein [Hyphomicrobium sp.]MBZ0208480.1 NfeD family protein [Hyphomicrobium sp.]MCZ7594662.1 NfeD family protein [Hyphomicrobium sp.]